MPWQPTNNLERERLEKLERLKARGIEPFPNRVQRTHTAAESIAAFEAAERDGQADQASTPITVSVTGRIRSIRITGKISFAHIEDGTGRIQLFIRQDAIGPDAYDMF